MSTKRVLLWSGLAVLLLIMIIPQTRLAVTDFIQYRTIAYDPTVTLTQASKLDSIENVHQINVSCLDASGNYVRGGNIAVDPGQPISRAVKYYDNSTRTLLRLTAPTNANLPDCQIVIDSLKVKRF